MSLAMEVLKAKRLDLQQQIAELRKGLRDIDAAIEVLDPQSGGKTELQMTPGAGKSHINAAILEAVRHGNGSLAEVYNYLMHTLSVDTTKASVSTRLSKMKNDGLIDHDGDKWILPTNDKGSGVSSPEPLEELGPATGRGTVFPATPPEGSIPSGSTDVQDLRASLENVRRTLPTNLRDLDDDIPF